MKLKSKLLFTLVAFGKIYGASQVGMSSFDTSDVQTMHNTHLRGETVRLSSEDAIVVQNIDVVCKALHIVAPSVVIRGGNVRCSGDLIFEAESRITIGGNVLASVGGSYARQEGLGVAYQNNFSVEEAAVLTELDSMGDRINVSAGSFNVVGGTLSGGSRVGLDAGKDIRIVGSGLQESYQPARIEGGTDDPMLRPRIQRGADGSPVVVVDGGITVEDVFSNVGVLDSTTLVGGVIQSDGFMRWISETVEGISIEEHAESEAVAAGISTNPNAAISGELSFNYATSNYKATAHACITGRTGTEIRGKIIGKVVTDPSKARDVTEDSSVEYGFVIPLTKS